MYTSTALTTSMLGRRRSLSFFYLQFCLHMCFHLQTSLNVSSFFRLVCETAVISYASFEILRGKMARKRPKLIS